MEDHGGQAATAPRHRDPILDLHEKFEPPAGFKAEVIGRQFVVSPPPSGRHCLMSNELRTQLKELMPGHLAMTNTVTLDMAATNERYLPDLLAIREDVLDTDEWLFGADRVELVAEIVSPSSADTDRETKVHGCAASSVPIYLLVDPLERSVTLFWEPAGGRYQHMHRVLFGASLALPEPYSGKLDTSVFG
jgi:Uma2 family endonuclease